MPNKLALFDCDGTLIDSQANICMAMEHAFEQMNLAPPPRNEIRHIVGLSLVEAAAHLRPSESDVFHRELAQHYKQSFYALRGQGLVHEPLYDGIKELIVALDRDDWMLGVATGKSDRGLDRCLTEHQMKQLFVTLQTADRHPSKPHPSMIHQAMADSGSDARHTVMIGDTSFDMEMGRAAGCYTIGVNWGYHSIEILQSSGADICVHNMDELGAALAQFKGA